MGGAFGGIVSQSGNEWTRLVGGKAWIGAVGLQKGYQSAVGGLFARVRVLWHCAMARMITLSAELGDLENERSGQGHKSVLRDRKQSLVEGG